MAGYILKDQIILNNLFVCSTIIKATIFINANLFHSSVSKKNPKQEWRATIKQTANNTRVGDGVYKMTPDLAWIKIIGSRRQFLKKRAHCATLERSQDALVLFFL